MQLEIQTKVINGYTRFVVLRDGAVVDDFGAMSRALECADKLSGTRAASVQLLDK